MIIVGETTGELEAELRRLRAGYIVVDPTSKEADVPPDHLRGDPRLEETLQKAGLARARVLIAATRNALLDISIAVVARSLRRDLRIVIASPQGTVPGNLASTLTPLEQLRWDHSATTAAAAALAPGVVFALELHGRLFAFLEGEVGEDWHGATEEQVRGEYNFLMVHSPAAGPFGRADHLVAVAWRRLRDIATGQILH